MATSTARVATRHASKYLQQLCKHWSHKFDVTFDASAGRVPLPPGPLDLVAEPATLVLTLTVADPGALDRIEPVVAEHLQRFAFREAPDVTWVRG